MTTTFHVLYDVEVSFEDDEMEGQDARALVRESIGSVIKDKDWDLNNNIVVIEQKGDFPLHELLLEMSIAIAQRVLEETYEQEV